jgi:hypothetical protein
MEIGRNCASPDRRRPDEMLGYDKNGPSAMTIDTSALVAVLDQEPEAERIARSLASTSERMLSAANLVEMGIVMQAGG